MARTPQVWPPEDEPGPHVRLTNADKVLYPVTGTTKEEVFGYYTSIAEHMLTHIAGRPATRKRWPNGVQEASFFEKQLAESAPAWLNRATIEHRSGATTYPIIDSPAAMAWIAQQAALEVHVPQWRFVDEPLARRAERVDEPLARRAGGPAKPGPATRLVFDLDPGPDVPMTQLADVARAVRDMLADIGLHTYPVTSGSKGLHLYVPLPKPLGAHGATTLAKKVAQQLEQASPKSVTSTMTKSVREGKVFVDWSQNSASKTTVAPYSLRGRPEPTVAAPRTWEELDDPDLCQLRFDEVLKRVAIHGDLLAPLDADVPTSDRLTTYRSMRDASRTPEPVPASEPKPGKNNRFVIQEHHARRLHYDLRLERDGVLVSWAVPKNLPDTPSVNHLAVHTEDHPLEYLTFEATIPKGEYGAGKMVVWDTGTYDAEKFRDNEVIMTLHGQRISGRYALIQTDGDQWLAHRMKDQAAPTVKDLAPMLATSGSVDRLTHTEWAFEGKWDGYRLLVEADHGHLRLMSRSGRDVTEEYPGLQTVADALADHHVVLDGEVVALDGGGVPSFSEMQNRARATRIEFWAFDVLLFDGTSLLRAKYRDRRRALAALAAAHDELIVHDLLPGDGADALERSRKKRWEGVVAKRWDSTYQPGRRSRSWIKAKNWKTQEIVIGGWRAGTGGRTSQIGALLMGIPDGDKLRLVGRVGTGFTEKELGRLKAILAPLQTAESPFNEPLSGQEAKGVTFVKPELVGEVRYGEWTNDGRLRHPSWRGMRSDKTPAEVSVETT